MSTAPLMMAVDSGEVMHKFLAFSGRVNVNRLLYKYLFIPLSTRE